MLYSQTCRYAIRALTFLAQQPEGTLYHLSEIAQAVEIPQGFSGRILGDLAKAGLLHSARGTTGGFALAQAPGEITLYQIKEVVDGDLGLDECVSGWDRCPSRRCQVHARWEPIREEIRTFLKRTTLADLANSGREGGRGR